MAAGEEEDEEAQVPNISSTAGMHCGQEHSTTPSTRSCSGTVATVHVCSRYGACTTVQQGMRKWTIPDYRVFTGGALQPRAATTDDSPLIDSTKKKKRCIVLVSNGSSRNVGTAVSASAVRETEAFRENFKLIHMRTSRTTSTRPPALVFFLDPPRSLAGRCHGCHQTYTRYELRAEHGRGRRITAR